MPDLSFDIIHIYTSTDGIKIPLVISFVGKEVQTSGYADCGAEACIFSNELGQTLGIDIEAGKPRWFGSASSGTLETFGHMVIIEFLGITLESIVYFANSANLRWKAPDQSSAP